MLDATDSHLLGLLQRDGQLTAEALGERLGLSASQASRRRARLEARGLITGYPARVDTAAPGLSVQAFIQVEMQSHAPDAGRAFAGLIDSLPEVVSAWIMTGPADYLLRVFCSDLPALNRLIQDVLLAHPSVARVQSQIVMDQPKADAPLPA